MSEQSPVAGRKNLYHINIRFIKIPPGLLSGSIFSNKSAACRLCVRDLIPLHASYLMVIAIPDAYADIIFNRTITIQLYWVADSYFIGHEYQYSPE